ncbi:MAG: YlxR family protein [Fimbriimonadaceae bacterium]
MSKPRVRRNPIRDRTQWSPVPLPRRSRATKAEGRQRTCVVCRQRFSPTELLRYHWDEGMKTLAIGPPKCGRSAYVCQNESCGAARVSAAMLSRALRRSVTGAEVETLNKQLLWRPKQQKKTMS